MIDEQINLETELEKAWITDTQKNTTPRKTFSLRTLRHIVMFCIAGLAYVATVWRLFFQEQLLFSMIPLLIFFVMMHFVILELKHLKKRKIRVAAMILVVIESVLLWLQNWQVPITVAIFHLWIVFLVGALYEASVGKRSFSWRAYFTAGAYIFSMFMTVSYSLFLIGGKGDFDLSCTHIQESSNSFVDTMMTPFSIGKKQVQLWGSGAVEVKQSLKNFFDSDVNDAVEAVGKFEGIHVKEESLWEKIISKFTAIKENIATTVDVNAKVSLGICDLILKRIEKLYEHPWFQFAIVFLMRLLLYPFVRVVFWVVTAVGFGLFELLYVLRVYKTKKVMKEVEELG